MSETLTLQLREGRVQACRTLAVATPERHDLDAAPTVLPRRTGAHRPVEDVTTEVIRAARAGDLDAFHIIASE